MFRRAPIGLLSAARFVLKPTRTTGHGLNIHRSNRAKNGLYHGKDIMSGHSISHSRVHSLRKWYPNVLNKRVWSDSLDDWVRFKMTARALKEIDNIGGIDKYIMSLDDRSVGDSNYITKMHGLISSAMFHNGTLPEKMSKKLGYLVSPPPKVSKPESTRFLENSKDAELLI